MQSHERPLINDFLDQLYMLRDDAAARTKTEADAIVSRHAAKGRLRSGATLVALAALIEREFETAVAEILSTLDHIKSRKNTDLQPFREQAFLRGKDIIALLIGSCDMEKWYGQIGRGSAADLIRTRLDKLYPRLEYKLRQFDAGLHRSQATGGMNVTHNVVNTHTISGVVQQAGDGAILHATAELDLHRVADATNLLEAEIANSSDGQDRDVRQLISDVSTIQVQLAAPKPKTSIIEEAIKGVRVVAEQAVGGALSPSIIAAAVTLGNIIR